MRNVLLEKEIHRAIEQVVKTAEYLKKSISDMENEMSRAKEARNIESEILLRQALKRKANDLAEQQRKQLHLQRQLVQFT